MENKNYIKMWMDDNGIEVGEEFYIIDIPTGMKEAMYLFTNDCELVHKGSNTNQITRLNSLLTNRCKIQKQQPKPTYEELEEINTCLICENMKLKHENEYLNFKYNQLLGVN